MTCYKEAMDILKRRNCLIGLHIDDIDFKDEFLIFFNKFSGRNIILKIDFDNESDKLNYHAKLKYKYGGELYFVIMDFVI